MYICMWLYVHYLADQAIFIIFPIFWYRTKELHDHTSDLSTSLHLLEPLPCPQCLCLWVWVLGHTRDQTVYLYYQCALETCQSCITYLALLQSHQSLKLHSHEAAYQRAAGVLVITIWYYN